MAISYYNVISYHIIRFYEFFQVTIIKIFFLGVYITIFKDILNNISYKHVIFQDFKKTEDNIKTKNIQVMHVTVI